MQKKKREHRDLLIILTALAAVALAAAINARRIWVDIVHEQQAPQGACIEHMLDEPVAVEIPDEPQF